MRPPTHSEVSARLDDVASLIRPAPGAYAKRAREAHVQEVLYGTIRGTVRVTDGLIREAEAYLKPGGSVQQAAACVAWAEVEVQRLSPGSESLAEARKRVADSWRVCGLEPPRGLEPCATRGVALRHVATEAQTARAALGAMDEQRKKHKEGAK